MCIYCRTSFGINKDLASRKCCMEHTANRSGILWTKGWWYGGKCKRRQTNIVSRFLFQWDQIATLFMVDVAHCNWAIPKLEVALGDGTILIAQIWSPLLWDQIFSDIYSWYSITVVTCLNERKSILRDQSSVSSFLRSGHSVDWPISSTFRLLRKGSHWHLQKQSFCLLNRWVSS